MFCNYCGSPIAVEQSVCSHCGKSVIGARIDSAARTRVAEHVHLLGILWFVDGAFLLVPALIMAGLAGVVTVPMDQYGTNRMAFVFAPVLFTSLFVFFLISAVLRFIVGWSLLKMQPWGRMFALIMAFLNLLSFPFGTALGVYTLFVLLPDAAADEYRKISQASRGPLIIRQTGNVSA